MFAFTVAPIIDNKQYKIECLETWGSKLLVGTADSGLIVYDVKEKDPSDEGFNVTIVEVQLQKSKPINQINVIESLRIMVSLSDGIISVHNLPTFSLRSTLNRVKGANLYSLDTSRSAHPSLCIAVKKKLYIYNWDGNDFVEFKEIGIADYAKALVWADQIFIGYKKDYCVIDPRTGVSTDIFPTGKTGNVLANFLPPDQVILSKESISIFVGLDGKPLRTRKFGLSWGEPPIVIGYKFPHVISLQSRTIEVRMVTGHQNMFQNIPMKVTRENPLKSITDKGEVYVSTLTQVWRLVPVPLLQQIDQLVANKEFEEAVSLTESVSAPDVNKAEKLAQIKNMYAYHLFTQGHYERAMDLFSELDVDPLQVIGLFPNLLPKVVKQKFVYPIDVPDLVGTALEKAYQALLGFLAKKRIPYVQQLANAMAQQQNNPNQNQQIINQQDNVDYSNCTDPATIIDTSLMKAYIKINEALLAPLLRSPNFCHIRECQKVLTEYKKYNELILLLKHKKLHREALDILQKTPGGASDTINYLKSLGKPNMNIIAEYSRWVLNVAAPEDALTIFTEERNPQDRLPPQQVVQLLRSARPTLVVSYLEHIIEKNGEKDPEFHNELIFQYLTTIKYIFNDPVYLESRKSSTAAGAESGLLGKTRTKLLKFLEDSPYYQAEKMFKIFLTFPNDLFEERAILHSRIGQHEAALTIYAHNLKKFALAEEYCARHYNPEKEDARDVYLSLLRVYLLPPDPSIPPMVQPAMNLLAKHYQRIDTPKALEILPSSIPIKELYPFFESVLRDITKNRRNNQVIKNLLKSENLQVREQLIKDRSHVIKITDERVCPVCTKRLGTSVFPCYVHGVVVHPYCVTNLQNQKKGNPVSPPMKQ